jgi:polyisoprenoid-binding protein YceI
MHVRKRLTGGTALLLLALGALGAAPVRADDYVVDGFHSSVVFKVQHMGISWIWGRFNDVSGTCTFDKNDPTKASFALTIKTESVDTGVKKRDDHLRSGDFFNANQFPLITFKSTSVKAAEGGYSVTGDFTMHGVTKSITFTLKGGKTVEFKGPPRIGFYTELTLKRSDFGMDRMTDMIGAEIPVAIAFEGVKKK